MPKDAANLKPYQFKPGNQVAVGHGRPPSSRNKLSELAIRTLTTDFENHGAEVIERVREKYSRVYLTAVVSLLPKHHVAEKISPFAELSDAELEQLEQYLTDMRASTLQQIKVIEALLRVLMLMARPSSRCQSSRLKANSVISSVHRCTK
jgi:hypothetical protein